MFRKDESERLTADCTPKNTYKEGQMPTEVTCKFTHVRFQRPSSSDPDPFENSILTSTLEEGEHVTQGRELLKQLRSPEEGPTVTGVDLHILRVQLFLLDHEAANMQQIKR